MRMHQADEDYSVQWRVGMLQEEGGGGGGVQMKCENTGSCLKHPLEGGAAEQMGVKELRDEHRNIIINIILVFLLNTSYT